MNPIQPPFCGKVYLVGAGPGDPDLLTVKAYRLLKSADVVVYDRLLHPQILDLAPQDCLRVYAGKEDRRHTIPQDDLNHRLVEYAQRFSRIIRLKGGDPFLFGRGGEEALYLQQHGVPFEIVPGITSALSVPAYAGIPVTFRNLASMCSIVTGHLAREDMDALPWDALKSSPTIVFLMAVSSRKEIARRLIDLGRPADEPVAFIQDGTLPQQKVILSNLLAVAETPPEVFSPAIFVIGYVTELHRQIAWFSPTPEKSAPRASFRSSLLPLPHLPSPNALSSLPAPHSEPPTPSYLCPILHLPDTYGISRSFHIATFEKEEEV